MVSFLLRAGILLALVSCTKNKTETAADPAQALRDRGKAIYSSACIACHNADPKVSGALGPDIAGSSRELLEARILRAAYPEGYKPKRESRTMVALPYLKDDIESLHAYLNSL
jgi:mono/diheme cytochrome c family protein